MTVTTPPNVGFISLGCPKNQLDCELMISRAAGAGFKVTSQIEAADAIVVNTCAFIVPAQEEAAEAIAEAVEQKEAGRCRFVIVAGCLPQYLKDRSAEEYPAVDVWLTPDNPGELGDVLTRLFADTSERLANGGAATDWQLPEFLADSGAGRVLTTPPSLAYLKIAEGCNHGCKFCVIPQLRGRYRSRALDDVITEARGLIDLGTPEVVLVSQDSSFYGRDRGDGELGQLLTRISQTPGDFWLRVMYLYPSHVTDGLLRTWAQCGPKLLPYFDVPVQHVSPRILKAMGRRGSRAEVDELFARIRELVPGAVIRTSLIVGYPGETEDEFNELYDWVAGGTVDRLGVFTYSDLPEMQSHALPDHVDDDIAAQRQDMLIEAQHEYLDAAQDKVHGTEEDVIIEEQDELEPGVYWGRTWRDAFEIDGMVRVESGKELELFSRVRCRITGHDGYDLDAEVV